MQIQGHGNFGSVDNDPPAAMRYTECRLEAFSMANYLADLEADTVDYSPNFDNSQVCPACLHCLRHAEACSLLCKLALIDCTALLSCFLSQPHRTAASTDLMQEEPSVLPSRVPALLVNGSSGIAVGIATKIPPHNLQEVVHGLGALINNPRITVAQLMQHIPGPDFPTGGGSDWPGSAYTEGSGRSWQLCLG